jgi:hypothetical protein
LLVLAPGKKRTARGIRQQEDHMTLDDFIQSRLDDKPFPRNAYVSAPGFRSIYVRVSTRFVEGKMQGPVLDLANLTAKRPGHGAFKRLIARLRHDWPNLGLFVENVLTERFSQGLLRMGFKDVGLQCYWMPPLSR